MIIWSSVGTSLIVKPSESALNMNARISLRVNLSSSMNKYIKMSVCMSLWWVCVTGVKMGNFVQVWASMQIWCVRVWVQVCVRKLI